MKKLFFIAIAFVCAVNAIGQTKADLSFKAEIANRNTDAISFLDRNTGKEVKKILVGKDGIFKDSFSVEEGFYMLFDGKEYTQLFLKNGYDLKLKMDAQKFDESIVYSGKGAVENNFLAKNAMEDAKYDYDSLLASNEEGFAKLIGEKKTADLLKLNNTKLDSKFVELQKISIERSVEGLTKYHQKGLEANKMNGTLSPSFEYDNYKGGKTKLEDFRGKYVYIDVWATWCGPCRTEIPFLKKMEEKYHGKNIVFLSMSIDKLKDIEKWKTMIKEKELGGVQVFADNDWNSQFVKDFNITGIPRFILIDPNGKIVKADAPRPSSANIQVELDALLN
ncbi:TlpA family protein disulfide reductase [Flavobacterium granuli]|uniref:Thiol-disulfide isomerase or thioredoxin n=1 Tax=Flavobacterium granuli TaxID=280093 RepID=A0A1M5JX47_9FLAO|nr:TlpA disulfide reductase family protein [Flavobacterium granuli]PRZ26088.1 thiol-disulfide isomerase/thioredoxin [Flavobacterium granuli]SHG45126.1 Thiol-disulfide isomerase or thioredoxin [Flavobacterium granuli]